MVMLIIADYARNGQYKFLNHFQRADVCLCICLYFIQGRAGFVAQGSNNARDMARAPLFKYVNEAKLKSIKTFASKQEFMYSPSLTCSFAKNTFNKHMSFLNADFISLLDNYEVSTGVAETVTPEELQENRLFIDSIMETDVMKVR